MGTTAGGLRYPEPTEPVAGGAVAIKNLALDVDTHKVATVGDQMSGALTVGADPNGVGTGVLTYPSGRIYATCQSAGVPTLGLVRRGSTGTAGDAGEAFQRFYRSASQQTPNDVSIGAILIAGNVNSVTYATTSDPRSKTVVAPADLADAAERAAALGRTMFRGTGVHGDTGEPVGEEGDLLSSHDIEDVAPYAVHGERDAVDDDGNPVFQLVGYAELVPLLFAALANALDRIAVLEAAP